MKAARQSAKSERVNDSGGSDDPPEPGASHATTVNSSDRSSSCLRHSRLWMANKTISLPDQLLNHKGFQDLAHPIVFPMAESEFLSRLCPGITRACGDSRKPDTLTSFAIDHVDDAD